MVLGVAMPIMIQNGITNFVSLLDNIMVGQVGTEQMSGVAIVNQLLFIYNLCIFGGVSGAGIFTAQYFGQGNDEGVRNTFRFKLWIGVILSCILVTLLAKLYLKYREMAMLQGILHSLRPAVVAMIGSAGISILVTAFWSSEGDTVIRLAQTNWSLVVIFIISLILLQKGKKNPIFVMVLASVMTAGPC